MVRGKMIGIGKTLKKRNDNYGSFKEFSDTCQAFKQLLNSSKNFKDHPAHVREGLEMICHKITRIINGKHDYLDSWVDIEGYARVTREAIQKEKEKK